MLSPLAASFRLFGFQHGDNSFAYIIYINLEQIQTSGVPYIASISSFSLRLCFINDDIENTATGIFHDNPAENSYNNHFWWIPMFFHPPPGAWRLRISELSFFCCKSSTKVPSAAAFNRWEAGSCDAQCWSRFRFLKKTAIEKFKTALVRFFRKYTLISATALAHIDLYMYIYLIYVCVCVYRCTTTTTTTNC